MVFIFSLFFLMTPGLLYGAEPIGTFMPENDLHLQIQEGEGGIDEVTFNQVLDLAASHYTDVLAGFGASLKINRLWNNTTVNASASQSGSVWTLNMYGGLARRTEVTADGFALVVCHELGHHLGGVVFYEGMLPWAASEGQSDYFATIGCAKNIWANQPVINATYEAILGEYQGGDAVKAKCDTAHTATEAQHLCYRAAVAGKSLGDLLAALNNLPVPQFNTPDTNEVSRTSLSHPRGQCRLDTYVAGAVCASQWDDAVIPGKSADDRNSIKAFMAAKPFACHSYKDTAGFRPRCWFNPRDIEVPTIDHVLQTVATKVEAKQVEALEPLAVNGGDVVIVSMTGTGNADLYVRYSEAPTDTLYDCRPLKNHSNETCEVIVPAGIKEIYTHAVGTSNVSNITIKITLRAESKLCRDHNDGIGEVFDCFDGYSCKLTDVDDPQNTRLWCIDY